jgi:type 2 lantibiotic biosynthesis protein LanM
MSSIHNPPAETLGTRGDLAEKVIPNAMDLPERIELLRSHPDLFSENPPEAARRKATWIQALATDEAGLETRLKQLGITPSELPLVLGDVRRGDLEAPSWWSVCEEVLAQPRHEDDESLPTRSYLTSLGVDSSDVEPIPYEHIFCAWIDVATERLRAQVPDVDTIIGTTVLREEQRGLLENLSLIARNPLLERFALLKAAAYDPNDLMAGLLSPTPPQDIYCKLVRESIADGTAGLMETYPAFARLIATRIECWVRTLAEFVERLDADREELERVFSPKSKLGALVGGGRGISDSHNGGRAVIVCKFENGTRIVYKPRSMSIDVAWVELVAFFNSKVEEDARLLSLQVIDHGLYGWMEFANRKSCQDTTELKTFYRRMGSLLGLIHMLQGNDFHLENVVAAGPNPIAIDLETISVGYPVVDLRGIEADPAMKSVETSVLRALLLPSVMGMRGRGGIRSLGAVGVELIGERGWKKHRRMSLINTDFQRWIEADGQSPEMVFAKQSTPVLENGDAINSDDYRGDLAEGYRTAYRSILEHQDEWLAPDGPLALLDDAWGRVLNRATNVYYRLFLETCNCSLLKSGLDRWIHGQRFRVGSTDRNPEDPQIHHAIFDAVVEVEESALTRGDVAYFIARGSGRDYHSPDYRTGEPIEIPKAFLKNSATEAARDQIARMGEDDLDLQFRLITSSYLTAQLALDGMHFGKVVSNDADSEPPEATRDATDDEVRTWLRDNLAMLESLAIRNGDKLNWIDAEMDVSSETARPSALGVGLYSGRGGLAVLFERAYRYFGDANLLRIAKGAVQREFSMLELGGSQVIETYFALEAPAGMMQRAGILSAFWALGRHEGHGRHRDMVHALLDGITDRTIELDGAFDVIGGSSGLMLLMMGMKREDPSFDHQELLIRLGEHLSRHTSQIDGIGWVANTLATGRPLCGFGHGRAGTGLALLEAGTHLNRTDFRNLGLEALRAEHELRLEGDGSVGWPDLRGVAVNAPLPAPPYFNAWCAGGDGIALSRAASLEYTDESFIREDLDIIIDQLRGLEKAAPSHGRRRHLCCGTSGRAEMFFSLAKLLDRDDLAATGQSISRRKLPPAYTGPDLSGMSLLQGAPGEIWAHLSSLHKDDSHLLLLRM